MNRTCRAHGGNKNCCKSSLENLTLFSKRRRRQGDNVKMDITETVCEDVYWIEVVQDNSQCTGLCEDGLKL
jgi:hypothetical protein